MCQKTYTMCQKALYKSHNTKAYSVVAKIAHFFSVVKLWGTQVDTFVMHSKSVPFVTKSNKMCASCNLKLPFLASTVKIQKQNMPHYCCTSWHITVAMLACMDELKCTSISTIYMHHNMCHHSRFIYFSSTIYIIKKVFPFFLLYSQGSTSRKYFCVSSIDPVNDAYKSL